MLHVRLVNSNRCLVTFQCISSLPRKDEVYVQSILALLIEEDRNMDSKIRDTQTSFLDVAALDVLHESVMELLAQGFHVILQANAKEHSGNMVNTVMAADVFQCPLMSPSSGSIWTGLWLRFTLQRTRSKRRKSKKGSGLRGRSGKDGGEEKRGGQKREWVRLDYKVFNVQFRLLSAKCGIPRASNWTQLCCAPVFLHMDANMQFPARSQKIALCWVALEVHDTLCKSSLRSRLVHDQSTTIQH